MDVESLSHWIEAESLLQHVSRVAYRGMPLYYGCGAVNRYDDPRRGYGVLYLAEDLPTALMESVFHKHQWYARQKRSIALTEIRRRMVRAVGVLHALRLFDLNAPGVMTRVFGLNLELLSTRHYRHTQQVSAIVRGLCRHDGAPWFDGIYYPSRNNFPSKAVALFEHAAAKVALIDDLDLVDHVDWPGFVESHAIAVAPDPGPAMPDPDLS